MSPELSELLKRALALSVDERAALANTLLDSLETTDQSVQQAWDDEVDRRIADLRAGKAVTVAWEQLHRELLAIPLRAQLHGIASAAPKRRSTSSKR